MDKKQIIILAGVLLAGILLGRLWTSGDSETVEETVEEAAETIYTCSMHPSVRQNEPGTCPICGMDLVPMDETGAPTGPDEVRMSDRAAQISQIETREVRKSLPQKQLRLNGRITFDERRKQSQSAHFPGRIEELYINFTGQRVQKGEKLALIYSPELVTAQRELLDALQYKEDNPGMVASAREKLKQWKITEAQIREIEAQGEVKRNFPVYAESSGYVVRRNKDAGDYLERGEALYSKVSLDQVWAVFEAYEQDIPWISEGDTIAFRKNHQPGEPSRAIVSYIDPDVHDQRRIARVRATLDNPGLEFRPGVFIEGRMEGTLSAEPVITAPKSAVMWTGPRSVVWLQVPDSEDPVYRYRQVELGEDLGDAYVIREGLETGEKLVTYGTFRIDAAAQLDDKASMMRPHVVEAAPEELQTEDHRGHVPEAFQADIKNLFDAYVALSDALADDDPETAQNILQDLREALERLPADRLEGEAHELFHTHREAMTDAVGAMHGNALDEMREQFEHLSLALRAAIESFGILDTKVHVLHCPMAFDNRGADWLYPTDQILNPYFGAQMLRCGSAKEQLE